MRRAAAAYGAGVAAAAAAVTGSAPTVLALVCAVTLPTTVWLALGPPSGRGAARALGVAHLLLLPLALLDTQGTDLRRPLTGALLAVAGLHASSLPRARDLRVMLGIQLAAVTSTLSQLVPEHAAGGAALLLALWGTAALLVLADLAHEGGGAGPPTSRRPDARLMRATAAVGAVAVVVWLLLPQAAGGPREAAGGGSGSGGTAAGPAGGAGGQARVGLSGSDALDLRTRGSTSDRPVLRVLGGGSELWRARAFDRYDGTTWQRDGRVVAAVPGGLPRAVPPTSAERTDRRAVTSVLLLEPQRSLLSVGRAVRVLLLGPLGVDATGDLAVPPLPAGTRYAVDGGGPASTAPGPGLAAPADASRWLQLPTALPARVGDLARSWTTGTTTPAQAAEALHRRLSAGYSYRLDSPVPPAGADAVDHFLFDARTGFCEQFASAEAVLLRTLGIPARLVTGYSTGTPQADGTTLVRDADAHAWVELWVPGQGWVSEDPTAGAVPAGGADRPSRLPLLRLLRAVPTAVLLVAAGLVVLLAAVATVVVRLRRRRTSAVDPSPGAAGATPPRGPVRQAFAALEGALVQTGAPRGAAETPRELLLRLPGGWGARRSVLPALEQEVWGTDPPTPEEAAGAVRALADLTAGLRPPAGPPER